MPPKRPEHEGGIFRPATLSSGTRVSMSLIQVFMFIGLIVSIAFAWWDLKSDLVNMRQNAWSINAERASWRYYQKNNPSAVVPDVDDIYRDSRR